jgi:rhamnosyltransferase
MLTISGGHSVNQSTIAVVVSFHPTVDIIQNIACTLEQVSKVIVVDNESTPGSRKLLSQFKSDRVDVIFNEKNLGVGAGFNQGVRWGQANGYVWFLLLDQDSRPTNGMVAELLKAATSLNHFGLAMVGPHHEDFISEWPPKNPSPVEPVSLLITSGCLLNMQILQKIGFYDERMFIDHVDHDYCLRFQKQGGVCLRINTATLLHRFGEARIKRFLGKNFFLQDYSPFRRYHMMRNRIVLYKRYGMFKGDWFWLDVKIAIKDLVKLTLFENEKRAKFSAVIRGFVDGLLWSDSK